MCYSAYRTLISSFYSCEVLGRECFALQIFSYMMYIYFLVVFLPLKLVKL